MLSFLFLSLAMALFLLILLSSLKSMKRHHRLLPILHLFKKPFHCVLAALAVVHIQRNGFPRGTMGWQGAAQSHSSYIVKKIVRLEVPTDAFPHFNFIGRLLGPRGNSLKRVEATTGCRVFIGGKGSIKDPIKKEQLKGRPGYEHLDDPTHILIEAELPADVIDARLAQAQEILEEMLKPVDEPQDYFKRQQLRELATLNSTYREDSPHQNGSASPFSNGGSKLGKQ